MKVIQMFTAKKARKWVWMGIAAFVALQIYFVREMLAALILFTGVFAIFALIVLAFYLVDQASQWSLSQAAPQARRALEMLRRGWVLAEEVSKKPFRRPRSQTARL